MTNQRRDPIRKISLGAPMAKERKPRARTPHNTHPCVYLRCVDPGTDNECWVVCAEGDPGAKAFFREDV
jgi:hypothetical protein